MPEIITCSSCQRQLQVPDNFAGQKVQCPKCGATFVAGEKPPPPLPVHQREAFEEPAPSRGQQRVRRRVEDDYDDDDDDRDYGRIRRRDYIPHRGTAVLTMGILSLIMIMCGPILGPIAWIMGNTDMKEIRAGRMDPSGEGQTNAGRICGIVATCFSLTIICLYGIMLLFIIGAGGGRFN